jgi:DNA polymerase bacteriophage-type
MANPFPLCELPVIDLTIRMFVEPRLEGDRALLTKVQNEEAFNKNERLYNLGVGESDLASADKFAAILEAEGIEVAMKPGKLKPIPALARTDSFMQELLNDDDERIRELAQARLDVKSTLDETRSARLGSMADRGGLCVYLHYCGAHTRRWSGGDSLNFQNLGRGSNLRRAIRAPQGFLLACPDQSQGECRILNWLAGQSDVVERFRQGADPYLPLASQFYRREITKADAAERGVGKQLELSCGFGSGWKKFQITAARGSYGPPVHLGDVEAQEAVNIYRTSHDKVVELWRYADGVLRLLAMRTYRGSARGWNDLLAVENGRIHHPNGTWLDYRGLKWEEGEWRLYGKNGAWSKMYGAKLVENVVQWLSRIVTAEAMVKFHKAGYPIVGMAHDDVWLLVKDHTGFAGSKLGIESAKFPTFERDAIIRIMSETPSWAPGLPLAADCKIGDTYA